jgi:hypothetical protein
VLGALFRGKFLDGLQKAYDKGQLRFDGTAKTLEDRSAFDRLRRRLYRKRWVVYKKPPFGGPEQVFRYLGRYTHRVGLSNRRLVSLDARGVTFRTRGEQTVTVTPDEFLRRFLLHVLPKGFVKIRHSGLFAPSNVSTKLATARRLLSPGAPASAELTARAPRDFRQVLLALTGLDLRLCPRCGKGPVLRFPLGAVPPDLDGAPLPPDTS